MKMCGWVGEWYMWYFQFLHLHQAPVLRVPTWIPKTKAVSRYMYLYSLCTKAMEGLGWKSLVVFERGIDQNRGVKMCEYINLLIVRKDEVGHLWVFIYWDLSDKW